MNPENSRLFRKHKAEPGVTRTVVTLGVGEAVTFGRHTLTLARVNALGRYYSHADLVVNGVGLASAWRGDVHFHRSAVDRYEGLLALMVVGFSTTSQTARVELLLPSPLTISGPVRLGNAGWAAMDRHYHQNPHTSWLMEWRPWHTSEIDSERVQAVTRKGLTMTALPAPFPLPTP
jgi:hypothetical protein